MSAVFGAFIQYLVQFIIFVAVAVAGVFTGKALLKRKKENDSTNTNKKAKK
ncbi:MAG: vanadium nitrogenase [Lachnospiraceae bacterium]|nr:vanadium nitrogenase [Lachnospiraceae bacterium]